MRTRHNTNQKTWVGVMLVAIGAYFLLRNLGMIPSFIPHYLFGWEMIFVLIGGSMLVSGKREGLIFMAIGGFFLLNDIFYWPDFRMRDWWPLILIAGGVSIFLKRRNQYVRQEIGKDETFFEDTNIFAGSKKSVSSENFNGGRITSVFGGSEVNFSNAQMKEGEVIVDIFCMFGGSVMIIPSDWTVINDSFVMFGALEDQRPKSIINNSDPKKILRIKGSVIFGGAEIKGA